MKVTLKNNYVAISERWTFYIHQFKKVLKIEYIVINNKTKKLQKAFSFRIYNNLYKVWSI